MTIEKVIRQDALASKEKKIIILSTASEEKLNFCVFDPWRPFSVTMTF